MKLVARLMLIIFLLPALVNGQESLELLNVPYTADTDDTLRQFNLVHAEQTDGPPPLLLWIGGGAWAYVDRHQEMPLCRQLAKAGITVASVGHRLSAQLLREPHHSEGVTHPAHIEDIAAAFAYLYGKADEYGFDRDRIFLGGFSSGAHLSTLLAADGKYLAAHRLEKDLVAGVVSVGGAFDIIHYRDYLTERSPGTLESHFNPVFGTTDEQLIDASPATYLAELSTPLLIISDTNTYPYNKHFENILKEANHSDYDVLHVGSLSHGELWKDMAKENSFYRNIVAQFILNEG